jgi:hypothetical protein
MATPNSFLRGAEGGKKLTEGQELTVGQYLRHEREKKSIPLETVSQVTRITKEKLEALERDDFKAISAPVFVRGFLRNYANFLGLDPGDVIARYESQIDLLQVAPKVTEPTPSVVKDETLVKKYLAFLGVLIIGVAIAFYFFQKSSVPPPQPEKAQKQPEQLFAGAPVIGEKQKAREEKNSLRVLAAEQTWLRIRTEDQPVIDVLLQPQETATWTSRGDFNITVGNAGGIEIFLNGVSQGRLGKSGEVVHLVLPKKGTEAEKKKP